MSTARAADTVASLPPKSDNMVITLFFNATGAAAKLADNTGN
jgi:hypothetical protein